MQYEKDPSFFTPERFSVIKSLKGKVDSERHCLEIRQVEMAQTMVYNKQRVPASADDAKLTSRQDILSLLGMHRAA